MLHPIPPWGTAELPEPKPLSIRNWTSFIGPGIVMVGIQIGGGEWLFGPSVTMKYGGSLMWLATIAIVTQVFFNIECGRYALYCGEPVFTGFMRCFPGPGFWLGVMLLLNISALIPGLSSHGAALTASLILGRPPTEADSGLIQLLAFVCLFAVVLPVLLGGKVYNMLQGIMTVKVILVLTFCLGLGLTCVSLENWLAVLSGFGKFGDVPVVVSETGKEEVANVFSYFWDHGEFPVMATASLGMLGAFAGYAGGGGLSNSTYSNFVRDKGWGMGSQVGAIPSAIGGKSITLSHVGKIFELTSENLRRWKGWWKYILTDQLLIWMPGCFLGMALPALLSMQFAPFTTITEEQQKVAQAIITADGIYRAGFDPVLAKVLWIFALITGMMVMLPSQMSIVDDFSRRWTDAIWSSSRHVQEKMKASQVSIIYYSILATYVIWSFICAWMFSTRPKWMTEFIANTNNVALGIVSFQVLWINNRLLPRELRPRWYNNLGVAGCGLFYLGLALLVFIYKVLPILTEQK